MNKALFFGRILLFHVVIVFYYLVIKLIGFVGYAELILVLMLIIYEILLLKDFIKKQNIFHKKYNFLSILVFMIIIIILLRCLFDPHFLYYDKALIKEMDEYHSVIYGSSGGNYSQFLELIGYYLENNAIYFSIMFVLLFIYRKLNLKKNNASF